MKMRAVLFLTILTIFLACNRKKSEIVVQNDIESTSEEVSPVVKIDSTRLRISYIGNMGVLMQSMDQTIIIDGFHKEYKPEYLFPSSKTVTELINGKYKSYDSIELALVTHNHRDHFDPIYMAYFLRKNEDAMAIGSQQVRDAIIAENEDEEMLDYSVERVPYDNDQYTFFQDQIEVRGVRCDHSNKDMHKDIENIGYLVFVNGYKILHVGDTDWYHGYNGMSDFRLTEEKIDVAILPYWMLLDPNSFAEHKSLVGAKKIIATHIPPNLSMDDKEKILISHANVTLFTELGQEFEM